MVMPPLSARARTRVTRMCAFAVAMYRESVTWQPMSLAIETERLTLRLRDERDAAWYRELIAERGEETPTLEEATTRLARFRDLTMEIGIGALAICRRAETDVIGYCALVVGRCSLDEPEIAYELLRRFHGHGYATEAAAALVAAAAATGRQRLWSTVAPWNAASLRVLEKLGFRREGTLREDCIVDGVVSDSWVYGLLRREWRTPSEPGPGH